MKRFKSVAPLIGLILIFLQSLADGDSSIIGSSSRRSSSSSSSQHGDSPCESSDTQNPFPGKCGKRVPSSTRRIINGEKATSNQLPWQARIGFYCGATIIDDQHVLTAAHCIGPGTYYDNVTVGVTYRENQEDNCFRQTRSITNIQIHPCNCGKVGGCGQGTYHFQYDVAVITLNSPLNFSAAVQPACLPSDDDLISNGTMTLVSGFGMIWPGGPLSERLRLAHLPIISKEECEDRYGSCLISDEMICAGYPEGGTDTCSGDSGGPVVVMDGNDRAVLVGVVSCCLVKSLSFTHC